ncbi:MAG: hypothetical protein AB7I32_05975 [Gammaproteobacteria bacterium]
MRARPSVRNLAGLLLAGVLCGAIGWAAFAPIEVSSRLVSFEIPHGTWARRMAGDDIEILPAEIRLTLGLEDILLLRNLDEVPQVFGPTLMMPGQSFQLPFAAAASYQFACTAHASGQMTIVVEPMPTTAWARLRWRWRKLHEREWSQWHPESR